MFLNPCKTRKIRKSKNITPGQAAEYMHLGGETEYLSRESGAVPISAVDLAVLAKLLGVPVGELTVNQ